MWGWGYPGVLNVVSVVGMCSVEDKGSLSLCSGAGGSLHTLSVGVRVGALHTVCRCSVYAWYCFHEKEYDFGRMAPSCPPLTFLVVKAV